ncbi:unnamed protein product [Mesocestoides corti]|uniref:Uncharacterized protein n=1 Tax=Mesocestoides corti TaxID=53468 RepID=A0A0R3U4E2_MESCO|nr:unnamed protein product [Mesocestoides corti]
MVQELIVSTASKVERMKMKSLCSRNRLESVARKRAEQRELLESEVLEARIECERHTDQKLRLCVHNEAWPQQPGHHLFFKRGRGGWGGGVAKGKTWATKADAQAGSLVHEPRDRAPLVRGSSPAEIAALLMESGLRVQLQSLERVEAEQKEFIHNFLMDR